MAELTTDELCYRLAKHVRNTDMMAPIPWAISAGNLLDELRGLDPERYDREVKGLPGPARRAGEGAE